MRNFREYEIWKSAIKLAKDAYTITATFPPAEKYGLGSQVQRAAVSISSNIAEGCSRQSEADFARMLEIALGSSFELETQMIIVKELSYTKSETIDVFLGQLQVLQKRLNVFIGKLRLNAKANSQ